MDTTPLISEHGLIGDLQTAALVSTDGSIDWLCLPRFDSPAVFTALVDPVRGGFCRIRPTTETYTSKQLYLPDTAVLVTRFMTERGVAEIIDFMPVTDDVDSSPRHRLVRIVHVVRGEMELQFDLRPAFDYGRAVHTVERTEHGAAFRAGDEQLTVHLAGTLTDQLRVDAVEGDAGGPALHGRGTLRVGDVGGGMLEYGAAAEPRRFSPEEGSALFDETIRFWRGWLQRSTYRGRWREQMNRSAITLKLLTYRPTGALVAAPTAGLPEQIGGERNWDYRFTWIRDASFSVAALLGMGFIDEARSYIEWLADRMREQVGTDSGPLKIMYRVDGSSDLVEEELPHLDGYAASRPVRIGNGASDQLQLDVYGEALDAIFAADRHGVQIGHATWTDLTAVLDWLAAHWDEPDEGVWETRGGRKDFTYGRINSWAAFDRGIRLARAHGRPGDVERWTAERDRIYEQVMRRGWNEERGAFVQHFDTDVVDAAVLRMAAVGMIASDDPLWASTLVAIEDGLVSDSLVYRYDPAASPDGLRGAEGTFSLCTFWYVESLARAGRLDEARLMFEKMLTYANHVGLYSEEIGLTGEQLGNFPQAFTHLALINAGLALDAELDAGRHGRGRH
ncbi:glycoside hydrolase family 15 protein [Curtobacterium sp. PhB146]|uniref:glycoside hydrolase family 15 protein n=1 Tax=Curtobacterium sp. PhB146 TaxID=2485187 RepID=UPI001043F86C|nr:glycoside hydrolase family 15 protein [Curtobacterium sp. PhB146]TCU51038.1 GH15 family glucan-1,4-alpha-glucosidase [Curtobacterium sp. PhB146]